MSHRLVFAYLLILSLSLLACSPDEPVVVTDDHLVGTNEMVVFVTDSDEWHVKLFKEHLLYAEAVKVSLPDPWVIPTRDDAAILKTLEYPCEERFITSDGYTFGMPSSSVSKAGAKTKYSVLGLWKRMTTIDVPF